MSWYDIFHHLTEKQDLAVMHCQAVERIGLRTRQNNIRTRLNQWAELLFPRDNNKFALGDKALSARLSIMNAEMARDRKNEARVKTHIAREFLEKAKQFFAEVPVNPR